MFTTGGVDTGDRRRRAHQGSAAVRRATDKLTRALTTSRLIGAAIGILIAQKINEDEAFHQLRRASQQLNRICPTSPTRAPGAARSPAASQE